MGINCSSEIFQNAIEEAIDGVEGAMNLIDDIIVWEATEFEHDKNFDAL